MPYPNPAPGVWPPGRLSPAGVAPPGWPGAAALAGKQAAPWPPAPAGKYAPWPPAPAGKYAPWPPAPAGKYAPWPPAPAGKYAPWAGPDGGYAFQTGRAAWPGSLRQAGLPMYMDEMAPLSPVYEPGQALQPIMLELMRMLVPALNSVLPAIEGLLRIPALLMTDGEQTALLSRWADVEAVLVPAGEVAHGEAGGSPVEEAPGEAGEG